MAFPAFDAEFSTSDIFDSAPDIVKVCRLPFIDYGGVPRFAGPCSTLRVTDDPTAIRAAFSEQGRGRILIIDGADVPECSLLGDILGAKAVENGWAGVVISGLLRDCRALRSMQIGVRALGTTARRPFGTSGGGLRDVRLTIGNTTFEPGMSVFVDDDAVITIIG